MANMTRRDVVKLAAATAGSFMSGGFTWAQVPSRLESARAIKGLGVIDQVPQALLRLAGLRNIPALPIDIPDIMESIPKLLHRLMEQEPAKAGLSNPYTIAGQTRTGREFLFGSGLDDRLRQALRELQNAIRANPASVVNDLYRSIFEPGGPFDFESDAGDLTRLSLETPQQWSISWTNYEDVYSDALPLLPRWAATLTDVTVAEEEFWPTIARYGVAYNLLILRKLTRENYREFKRRFGRAWTHDHVQLLNDGLLYVIDMSIFEGLRSNTVDGFERFTPASITLLKQDPVTRTLRPIAILVSGEDGAHSQTYTAATATPSAWLYAMLAAKTSVTVYGIWLGHVYQWHVVTAAMLMTMHKEFPRSHPVRQLLSPQSDYLIGFDDILLLLWRQIAPPTSVSTPLEFLQLLERFGRDRPFAADNPKQALAHLGLDVADFTTNAGTPWDQYPIVGYFLEIWDAAEAYVAAAVDQSYANDHQVRADRHVQAWVSASSKSTEGNVTGLGELNSKTALKDILTSLIYRITVHGVARLSNTANPAMTFVPNFPPCLLNSAIPDPAAELDTLTLLSYLPRTGTIGLMVTFYFTFAFTAPYVPFIPEEGLEAELFFPGGVNAPRNQALIEFRRKLKVFIEKYQSESPQLHQWPRNIET